VKNSIRTLLFVAAAVVVAAPSAGAQTTVLKAEVQKDWAEMQATIMKIADAMPEDKFAYKSTPAQRNYGEQILHIATANLSVLQAMGGKATAPVINAKATAKAEILKALNDSFEYGNALIAEQTPDTMLGVVKARFLGDSTRARVFYQLIGHTWDVYGQMAVYLRLNGLVPPASQGRM
jgi:hypothetical protein